MHELDAFTMRGEAADAGAGLERGGEGTQRQQKNFTTTTTPASVMTPSPFIQ